MKKIIVGIIVLAVVVWGGVKLFGTKEEKTKETIKIGGAFGQTGTCAEWGEGELKAAQLAIDETNSNGGINGKLIQLISEDTLCDNKTTVSAISKLINVDKVTAIIGPTWGDSFQAGYPLIRKHKVVSINPSTALEALEFQNQPLDYIFSTWFPQRAEIDALQKYAFSTGIKKITIVHDQDPFGAMMAGLFKDEAIKNNIVILEEHSLITGNSDFRTIIAKIKSNMPDGIFVSFLGPEEKVKFLKQIRELGINTTVFSSADFQNEGLLSSFGSFMEGVIYSYPKISGNYQNFIDKYTAKYGVKPQGPSVPNAYDAARALIEALKYGVSAGDEIQNQLSKIKIPGTVVSELSFSEITHQINGGDFEIKTVRNNKFKTVK